MLPSDLSTHIETKRLELVPLTHDHAAFIEILLNTDGWIQFIGQRNINNLADAEVYIQTINQNPALHYWVIQLKETNAPIGILTLIQRTYLEDPDIGFALLPAYHRNGYITEAANALIQQLMNEGNVELLLATTDSNNEASIALLQKIGFRFREQIQPVATLINLYEYSPNIER